MWAGPVLSAEVHFDGLHDSVRLDGAQVSLIEAQAQDLRDADGLFGLAYSGLDTAHDVRDYLSERGIDPPLTWPWPFDKEDENLADFATLLKEQPRVGLTPLYTALADAGAPAAAFVDGGLSEEALLMLHGSSDGAAWTSFGTAAASQVRNSNGEGK